MEERTISIDGKDEISLMDFIHDNTDPGIVRLSFGTIARLSTMEIGEGAFIVRENDYIDKIPSAKSIYKIALTIKRIR